MNKIIIIISSVLICFLFSSCLTLNRSLENPSVNLRENLAIAKEKITTSYKGIIDSSSLIKDSALNIKSDTKEIKEKIPQSSDGIVEEKLENIDKKSDSILSQTNVLFKIGENIKDTEKNIDKAEEYSKKTDQNTSQLEEKIKQLENDKQLALRKMMNYLIVIAILLIAISAIGVSQGNYKAFGGIVGGVVIIAVSLSVSVFYAKLAWIALLAIIGVILIVVFGVYQGIQNNKERKKDVKALEETVLTVEALKDKLPEDVKKDFFGERAYPGKTKNIQSKETEEKILNIRRKLNDVLSPTIPDEK